MHLAPLAAAREGVAASNGVEFSRGKEADEIHREVAVVRVRALATHGRALHHLMEGPKQALAGGEGLAVPGNAAAGRRRPLGFTLVLDLHGHVAVATKTEKHAIVVAPAWPMQEGYAHLVPDYKVVVGVERVARRDVP